MKILSVFLTMTLISGSAFAGLKEKYELVKAGEAKLLDVRERDEVEAGMVKDAQWYPLSQAGPQHPEWEELIEELKQEERVFVYCRSGARSQEMQHHLQQEGIKSENLGGFQDFLDGGIPTRTGPLKR
jgi:rhodanese-related sulfurtransferase